MTGEGAQSRQSSEGNKVMLDEKDLLELDIQPWAVVSRRFRRADLLLGNGFSIGIAPRLNYDSLFDRFLTRCCKADRCIFQAFGTANFELILEKLSNARDVNRIFDIGTAGIEDAIDHLKDGLVSTIQDVHPRRAQTDQCQLERIARQLDQFDDIFTLNYDLLLSRILDLSRDRGRRDHYVKPYSDFFWTEYDARFLRFDDSTEFEGYRHPYYLHGALFLFKEPFYEYDLKLRRADSPEELIEVIAGMIGEGRMPLFVSEGRPEQKWQAISRSRYLTFALDRLKESKKSLVVFGTSLSDPDRHIVEAINIKNGRNLAVSLHIGTKSKDEVSTVKYSIKSKFPSHEVVFFSSNTLFDFE